MAEMFPKQPTPETKSQAEVQLFERFQKHLSNDYTVFHSCSVQMPYSSGGVKDREIDFVIAHPQKGILLLEVKGGKTIEIDPTSGQWYRHTSRGREPFSNPVEQVKDAAYTLFQYLQRKPSTQGFDYATWYAVALPDVDINADISPGIREEIILDQAALLPHKLSESINGVFKYYERNDRKKPPGERGLKALGRVLMPHWFLKPFLGTDIEYDVMQIRELTEQQYVVLEMLAKKRALIAGCAGSGKTMLALEKARRYADDGMRVLFTCYNKALAEHIETLDLPDNILVRHFHRLAINLTTLTGVPINWSLSPFQDKDKDGLKDLWQQHIPEQMLEAADKLAMEEKFDAIVVDEGQDFLTNYWLPLQMLLRDPDEGYLYIFYDDAQRIYSEDEFPIPGGPDLVLKRNLRSTQEIGETVKKYYPGKEEFIVGGHPSNREVMVINPSKFDSPHAALQHTLKMLTDEQVNMKDVVILTMASEERSDWEHDHKFESGHILKWRNIIRGKKVRVSTIHRFKGLERPVVILTELDRCAAKHDEEELLYVGLSRAKGLLIVLGELPKPFAERQQL